MGVIPDKDSNMNKPHLSVSKSAGEEATINNLREYQRCSITSLMENNMRAFIITTKKNLKSHYCYLCSH